MMKPAGRLSAVVLVAMVFLMSCVVSRVFAHHRGAVAAGGRARGAQNCTTMVVPTDQRPGFRHAVTVGEPCPVAMSGAVAAI